MTSDGGGGLVSARDFVYVSKKGYDGLTFVMGGRSVEYREAPAQGKIVRAYNGPGCQMVTPDYSDSGVCQFLWLMDCDYKVRLSCLLSSSPHYRPRAGCRRVSWMSPCLLLKFNLLKTFGSLLVNSKKKENSS